MPPESSVLNSRDSFSENLDDSLVLLIDALEDIDESKVSAELNETSMTDSNGRRIYY